MCGPVAEEHGPQVSQCCLLWDHTCLAHLCAPLTKTAYLLIFGLISLLLDPSARLFVSSPVSVMGPTISWEKASCPSPDHLTYILENWLTLQFMLKYLSILISWVFSFTQHFSFSDPSKFLMFICASWVLIYIIECIKRKRERVRK
jgi:hypothetical protein